MQTLELDPALLDALRRATRVAVLTGAGVSAESGVPTFRDALTGLWATFDPQRLATQNRLGVARQVPVLRRSSSRNRDKYLFTNQRLATRIAHGHSQRKQLISVGYIELDR